MNLTLRVKTRFKVLIMLLHKHDYIENNNELWCGVWYSLYYQLLILAVIQQSDLLNFTWTSRDSHDNMSDTESDVLSDVLLHK